MPRGTWKLRVRVVYHRDGDRARRASVGRDALDSFVNHWDTNKGV